MRSMNVKGVILDWAGTSVDYGSFAPVAAFIEVFKNQNIDLTASEIRRFMGYHKRDHAREILKTERVSKLWFDTYKRNFNEDDVQIIFDSLQPSLAKVIQDYSDPIDGAIEFLDKMRSMGIKIGSTTGYVKEMMDLILPITSAKGFQPDCLVCPSEVPAGRPYPWMCYMNAIKLNVFPMSSMVKFGDTIADIEEGRNAGMWTVGITKSGNLTGLTQDELNKTDNEKVSNIIYNAEKLLFEAGAHYVIEGIWEAAEVINEINERIEGGDDSVL